MAATPDFDLARATEFMRASLGRVRAEADILHALDISPRTLCRWRRDGIPENRADLIHWLLSFAEANSK